MYFVGKYVEDIASQICSVAFAGLLCSAWRALIGREKGELATHQRETGEEIAGFRGRRQNDGDDEGNFSKIFFRAFLLKLLIVMPELLLMPLTLSLLLLKVFLLFYA